MLCFRLKKAGVQIRPYFRLGSLPEVETSLAAYAIKGLQSHWACPACGIKVLGTIDDIVTHLSLCAEPHLKEASREKGARHTGLQREPRQVGGLLEEVSEKAALGQVKAEPGQLRTKPRQAESAPMQGKWEEGAPSRAANSTVQEYQEGVAAEECNVVARSEGLSKVQEGGGTSTGARRRYTCDACEGKTFLFTGTQILQHRMWHSKAVS